MVAQAAQPHGTILRRLPHRPRTRIFPHLGDTTAAHLRHTRTLQPRPAAHTLRATAHGIHRRPRDLYTTAIHRRRDAATLRRTATRSQRILLPVWTRRQVDHHRQIRQLAANHRQGTTRDGILRTTERTLPLRLQQHPLHSTPRHNTDVPHKHMGKKHTSIPTPQRYRQASLRPHLPVLLL